MKMRSGAGAVVVLLVMAAGGRAAEPLVNEVIVNASAERVWEAFTVKEQLEQWMVPAAVVDLRVGGSIRTSYHADEAIPGPNSIEHRILSFEPNRMLSMRVVKCPVDFEFAEQIEQTWSVITMDEVAPERTHVRIAGVGYAEGEVWEKMRRYFQAGNDWTFQQLKAFLERDAPSTADEESRRTLDVLHRLTGGEWIVEDRRPDGEIFRARNVLEHGPDGRSVVSRGWLGDPEGMFFHSVTQIYADPTTESVQFRSVDQDGALSQGTIRAVSPDTLVWAWHHMPLDRPDAHYEITTAFEGDDAYVMTMKSADEPPFVVRFTRVDESPEVFRTLRQALISGETGDD